MLKCAMAHKSKYTKIISEHNLQPNQWQNISDDTTYINLGPKCKICHGSELYVY